MMNHPLIYYETFLKTIDTQRTNDMRYFKKSKSVMYLVTKVFKQTYNNKSLTFIAFHKVPCIRANLYLPNVDFSLSTR